MACNCKLPKLVESHDLAGLQKAMEDPILITCFTYPCHFQPGQNKQMRDSILEHQSAVERACVLGHFDMLELFVVNGCSANLPTSHGRLIHTVLTSLKSNRHLIDNGMALKLIRLLLRVDCDVDVKDYKGKSPLMLASELADPAIMEEILKNCLSWQLCSPNKDNGHTPLHMACMNGSVQCVLLLLKYLSHASLSTPDAQGVTPLACSFLVLRNNLQFHSSEWWKDHKLLQVQYSHMAIIEILYAAGASPEKLPHDHLPHSRLLMASQTAICMALEVTYRFEAMMKFCRAKAVRLSESEYSDKLSPDNLVEISDGGITQSPYAELVRMLMAVFNINPFTLDDKSELISRLPCLKDLIAEMFDFSLIQERNQIVPPSLLHQTRNVIHLQVAKCDKLCLMEELPLPKKLKDFVKFSDF